MPDFLNIDLVQLVQLIGYPGIAAVIFLESGVFFGFFLPGGSLLFTAGVLASADVFNIWILLPLLISAAILGDNVGYWFGAKVGIAIFKREDSRFFKKKHVERAQAFSTATANAPWSSRVLCRSCAPSCRFSLASGAWITTSSFCTTPSARSCGRAGSHRSDISSVALFQMRRPTFRR